MDITILSILVLFISFIVSLIGVFKENKESKDFTRKRILIILILFGLALSIFAELRKRTNEAKDANNKNKQYISIIARADTTLKRLDSNLHVSDSILSNTGRSVSQLKNLQYSTKQINDSLSKQLAIQIATNNEQTGGNSFCYADIRLLYMGTGWMELISLWNNGEYSLRNVHVEIEKPDIAFQNQRNRIQNETWVVTPLKNEYFVGKHSKIILYQGWIPDSLLKKEEIVYHIDFFLGNGNRYTQVYKFRMKNGVPIPATKINETTNHYYKYEWVHPLYPQKPINWDYLKPLTKNTFLIR